MRHTIIILFILCANFLHAQIRDKQIRGGSNPATLYIMGTDTTTGSGTRGLGKWYLFTDLFYNTNDSLIFEIDSVCIIYLADTLCVSQDSFFLTDTTLCIVYSGDTICTPYTADVGVNFYNSNGTFIGNRTGEMLNRFVRFTRNGQTRFGLFADGAAFSSLFQIDDSNTSDAITRFHNAGTGDAFVQLSAQSERYSLGIDKSISAFVLSEELDLSDPAFLYYGDLDSLVLKKDIQIDAGLIDNSGAYGTSGQVATSSGSGWSWGDSGVGGDNIYNLSDTIHDECRIITLDSSELILTNVWNDEDVGIKFRGGNDNTSHTAIDAQSCGDAPVGPIDWNLGTIGYPGAFAHFGLSYAVEDESGTVLDFYPSGLLYIKDYGGGIGSPNTEFTRDSSDHVKWDYKNRDIWIDTTTTSLTISPGHYTGVAMTASGSKTVTLPEITSSNKGIWFIVYNASESGDITVSVAGGGDDVLVGSGTLVPHDHARFEAARLTAWLKN